MEGAKINEWYEAKSIMKTKRLPDFIGLGTQKGGTTTLHELLSEHPQIYLPKCKEVHYFDNNYKESTEWYAKHFANAKEKELCGEITPYYLFHHNAAERMHELLPNAKLIVLLRDPVERAISHIFHAQKRGFETLNIKESLEAERKRLKSKDPNSLQKHSYVARSKYFKQLQRYEKYYSRDKILIIKSESLFEETKESWKKILDFLEIKHYPLPSIIPKANKGIHQTEEKMDIIRKKLRKELEQTYQCIEECYDISWKN